MPRPLGEAGEASSASFFACTIKFSYATSSEKCSACSICNHELQHFSTVIKEK
jgi:hypothetical protein